jgi:hypothetical protein
MSKDFCRPIKVRLPLHAPQNSLSQYEPFLNDDVLLIQVGLITENYLKLAV